jgi:uncharacterized protein (DUF1778 family)
MQSYIRINLALPKEIAEWVKREAQHENRSINNYILTLILKEKRGKELVACISKQ